MTKKTFPVLVGGAFLKTPWVYKVDLRWQVTDSSLTTIAWDCSKSVDSCEHDLVIQKKNTWMLLNFVVAFVGVVNFACLAVAFEVAHAICSCLLYFFRFCSCYCVVYI